MELKHGLANAVLTSRNLLIVPYGIETNFASRWNYWLRLLIVPYGIETRKNTPSAARSCAF